MLTVKQKIFIARMMNRCLRPVRRVSGLSMRARCRRKGIEWDLDLDEGIDLSIYLLGAYESRSLRAYARLVKPGDVCFDIGANIGAHTLHLARLAGDSGRVFAFEPTEFAAAKLRENLALNPGLARTVSFHQSFLVADAAAVPPKAVPSRWPVANRHDDLDPNHLGKPEALGNASVLTADAFCTSVGLQRLDFVKVDVDGYEHSVLRGFRENLRRFRPRILVELAPFAYGDLPAHEFADFINFLSGLGYDFIQANTGRPISSDPSALQRQIAPGSTMNCLLFPSPARSPR